MAPNTSAYRGTVGSFALALVSGGMARQGETLYAVYAVYASESVPVLVTDPVFYAGAGVRGDGDPLDAMTEYVAA